MNYLLKYIKDFLISLFVFVVLFFIQLFYPDLLSALIAKFSLIIDQLKKLAIDYPRIAYFIVSFVGFVLTFIIKVSCSALLSSRKEKAEMRKHFEHSFGIVQDKMVPAMKERVSRPNSYNENKIIDRFIQSPIEYVNETVQGNQVPSFKPDDTYQDVLYDNDKKAGKKTDDKEIKYIVAITAENPNLFLDPTIGFYMSNCYAASLIRHTNDFIKNSESKPDSIPQMCVKNLEDLEDDIDKKRQTIIDKLKDEKDLENYEFIRIFMYDKNQRECCDNAVFPSLKASQDLFRTLSFYIQKEKLEESLHRKGEWDQFFKVNQELWHLFDSFCENRPNAKKVQSDRINNTVPEFLFVFYKNRVGIHTYLGGEYSPKTVNLSSDEGDAIRKLIWLFAEYVDEDKDKGQLQLGKQLNKHNTFIDWEWVPK